MINQQNFQLEDSDSINQEKNCKRYQENNTKYQQLMMLKPTLTPSDFSINLFTCLQITKDGVIRFFPSLQPVYFGFNQQQLSEVEDFTQQGLINIKYISRRNKFNQHSFQQAIQFINQVQDIQQEVACQIILRLESFMNELKSYLSNLEMSENIYQQKDQEFQTFQNMCMNFMQEYQKQYPNKMLSFCVERISQKYKDIDTSNYGYSKAYLDLLGINAEILSQIILRGKQIDLIPKKRDITQQTLISLSRLPSHCENIYVSEIVTFDGFPLKLIQNRKSYSQLFSNSTTIQGEFEYHFQITEMDVDLYDLEQLINYRQRLMKNQNISYDDFLRKELSYLFEDVEYSIHSQSFIEQFYSQNLQDLQKQQNNECDVQKSQNKQCGFKII